jgi:hypothetical protein
MKGTAHFPYMLPTDEQQDWLQAQFAKAAPAPKKGNPCIALYGEGPAGCCCKSCMHLVSHRPGKRRFYKCALRKITHGPGSDHRVGWPACAKYEETEK